MLRVTIEVIPFGREEEKYEIGNIKIANKGRDIVEPIYKYDYEIKFDEILYSKTKYLKGKVKHKRDDNVLVLLYKILKKEIKNAS